MLSQSATGRLKVGHTAKIPVKFNSRFILTEFAVYMALSQRRTVIGHDLLNRSSNISREKHPHFRPQKGGQVSLPVPQI